MLSKKLKAVYDGGVALANERGLAASNDGNITTPARTNTQDTTYSDDNDAYALGILLTCCSESQQQYVAEADTQNLATVIVHLEAEYKAAICSGALTNPKSGSNDDHALIATVKPGKCNWCQRKGHWEAECRSKQAGRPRKPTVNNPKGNSGKKDQNKEDPGTLPWMK
ncbi:hypothetical protein DYB36_014081 [Aphanomyces astaci]|uniref:CCHC-type domain-containing protein n=1 Tax=Aphanomyces astaci TaxID=112090 RepID=A0A396ZWB9_APHAT|nr:hypothetical protein DYB36_014081 [Aphanomyces astaci]